MNPSERYNVVSIVEVSPGTFKSSVMGVWEEGLKVFYTISKLKT